MSPAAQTAIVALIGLFFAWRAFVRYAPKSAWRLRATVAFAFEQPGRPAWAQAIGRRLRPALIVEAGCGTGCGSCRGCGTGAAA